MTTLPDRPHTALLVIDMQGAVIEEAYMRDAVIANVRYLIERARHEGVAVVWVQHHDAHIVRGSPGWRIASELKPSKVERVIEKSYGDAFEDTALESVLSDLSVGRLIIVGAETDACIRSTLHGAFVRGYDALLVSDAHTTCDQTKWGAPSPAQVIAHTNLYWTYQTAPGRAAGAIAADKVDFSS
jgi:nicotinamidase-related amidase